MLSVCEKYAVTHGLRYNTKKSEVLIFKAGSKTYSSVPPLYLGGTLLNRVTKFKYLVHWVTENGLDDTDIERERRALAVRCNMLARRFARCDKSVKVTLFQAYCQSFYTCNLWTKYSRKAYNALRVQYNDAFRVLMGLPRYCSASGMFTEARVDDFYAIIRKRTASLMRRVTGLINSLVSVISNKINSPIMSHWNMVHVISAGMSHRK
ncbi:uncharacterized protein [Epargyreus clarus]|uniref:uncharacterized protein n=1 Tax=Epargyreus clarus TaxID=520877 RepID=UPI003C2F715D